MAGSMKTEGIFSVTWVQQLNTISRLVAPSWFLRGKILSTLNNFLLLPLETRVVSPVVSKNSFHQFSTSHCSAVRIYPLSGDVSLDQPEKCIDFERKHDADVVIAKVIAADSESEVFQSLVRDFGYGWKHIRYKPLPEMYDKLVDILGKMKQMEKMKALVDEMREDRLVSLNTIAKMMRRLAGAGDWKDAVRIFDELANYGLEKNTESMNSNFYKVYEVLDEMEAQGCPPNVFYNALIHTLGRAGHVEEALYVFTNEMSQNKVKPNTSTYNTMIAMFCHHRQEQRAVQYLRNLESSQYCKPDVQSFYPLLKLYFRDGKTDKCLIGLLDDMVKKHHLCLDLATFTLLIHGLCRANKCEWAYELFGEMLGQNIKPRYLTCSLLLQEIKQKNMHDAAEDDNLVMHGAPPIRSNLNSNYIDASATYQRFTGITDSILMVATIKIQKGKKIMQSGSDYVNEAFRLIAGFSCLSVD
ncbi:hypothetical protein DH2020_003733 [Rehmannia glutinosa]|uniref:Pentatricopeptide repeat-containing protein n=1 Tax=Rehmannia glutinosa TaxID=99300 RepID=A0ABR0XMF1_REHGL